MSADRSRSVTEWFPPPEAPSGIVHDAGAATSTASAQPPGSQPPRLLDRGARPCAAVLFHGKRHLLEMAGAEVAAFLGHLATHGAVSASTQNQAFSALLFL